jgi:hypothetical protein
MLFLVTEFKVEGCRSGPWNCLARSAPISSIDACNPVSFGAKLSWLPRESRSDRRNHRNRAESRRSRILRSRIRSRVVSRPLGLSARTAPPSRYQVVAWRRWVLLSPSRRNSRILMIRSEREGTPSRFDPTGANRLVGLERSTNGLQQCRSSRVMKPRERGNSRGLAWSRPSRAER